jgi:hypothetical protein
VPGLVSEGVVGEGPGELAAHGSVAKFGGILPAGVGADGKGGGTLGREVGLAQPGGAVEPGHFEADDERVVDTTPQTVEGGLPVVASVNVVAVESQQAFESLDGVGIGIDDQNTERSARWCGQREEGLASAAPGAKAAKGQGVSGWHSPC